MRDVIIGAIEGHKWADIEQYVVSLHRSGFAGDKLMFVRAIPTDTRVGLQRYGWQVKDCTFPPNPIHFHMERFRIAAEWLKDHAPHRYVIWMDVRDVVFQSDPAAWLDTNMNRGTARLLIGSESMLLRDEPSNSKWALYGFGQQEYDAIKDLPYCNSGTIAGDAVDVQALFDSIYLVCRNMRPVQPNGDHRFAGINDQAALTWLVRQPLFRNMIRIPTLEEGLWAVCHALSRPERFGSVLTEPGITMTSDGVLVNAASRVFSIIHQYDRNPVWKAAILRKWSEQQ